MQCKLRNKSTKKIASKSSYRYLLYFTEIIYKPLLIYWVNQKYFTEEAYNFNVKFANCHGKGKLLLVRPVLTIQNCKLPCSARNIRISETQR